MNKKISNMTDKELKNEFEAYNELVNGENSCYGVRDMMYLLLLESELVKRGFKFRTVVE
jgi:hypothetical protein